MYMSILFQIRFPYRLLQNPLGLCRLFYIQWCANINFNFLVYPSPFPFGNHKFVFYVSGSISVL